LVLFTEIATVNKEIYIDILRRLREAARSKFQEKGKPTVGFSFATMLQHTGRFKLRIS